MDAEERERIRAEEVSTTIARLPGPAGGAFDTDAARGRAQPLAWVAPILAFVLVGNDLVSAARHLDVRANSVINRDVFNVVLGALVTAFTTVMAYYFGSSLGSSRKDDALHSGRLVTNPKMKEQDGGEPADDEAPAPLLRRLPRPRKKSGPAHRGETHAGSDWDLWPVPAKGARRSCAISCAISAFPRFRRLAILGNIGWECGGFKATAGAESGDGRAAAASAGANGPRAGEPNSRSGCERTGFNYQNDAANYGFLSERTAWFASGQCPRRPADAERRERDERVHARLRAACAALCASR